MSTPNIDNSGDGSRPTTDGGVDNIGAAGSFTPGQQDSRSGPAPREAMTDLRKNDKASVKADDSAPLGLKASTDVETNTEQPGH
ncbi:MAG: hypothetical protein EOO54_13085 [Haliea sp.]|nr:MAG: hypothetical protein EOO54_13085 [Haliea sp.]